MKDKKETEGKPDYTLMPMECDKAYHQVSNEGLNKYGSRDSWKNNDPDEGMHKYLNATIGHAKRHLQSSELDPEGGLPHVYKVLWNAACAVWHYERGLQARQDREVAELNRVQIIQALDDASYPGDKYQQTKIKLQGI